MIRNRKMATFWLKRLKRDLSSRIKSNPASAGERNLNLSKAANGGACLDHPVDNRSRLCSKRNLHLDPICQQVKGYNLTSNQRQSFLYATPAHVTEEHRSKLKYLTSKTNHSPPNPRPAPIPTFNPDNKPEDGDEDIEGSISSTQGSRQTNVSGNETISVTATRNETAREFIRPADQRAVVVASVARNRITCPKPNAMSPYSRHGDDMEAPTLKDHYMKVLLNPGRSTLGVSFPANTVKQTEAATVSPTKLRVRRYDQYMTPADRHVVDSNLNSFHAKNICNVSQHRFLQSNAANRANVDRTAPVLKEESSKASLENNYNYLKRKNVDKYLDMCSASPRDHVYIEDDKTLRRKHVEMVKMEVIKLDNHIRRSKHQATDINRELEHVLQEALDQCKVYEHNLCHSNQLECGSKNEDVELQKNKHFVMAGGQPPRSSHTSVVFNSKHHARTKASFDGQIRNRMRSRSEDGKHCYNVLKSEEFQKAQAVKSVPKLDVQEGVSFSQSEANQTNGQNGQNPLISQHLQNQQFVQQLQNLPNEDVSMALTDLNSYEDIGADDLKEKGQARVKKCSGRRASKELRLAQKQHHERVLEVLDIAESVKVK